MSGSSDREILNIEEAAALLGVSIKTFNKVLHTEERPARKIGREWKFSRRALINWVGSGKSREFYRDSEATRGDATRGGTDSSGNARRTQGWHIETD